MCEVQHPNKIYKIEYNGESWYEGNMVHFVIIVAASNIDVARECVKENIGIDVEPIWLMNAVHPTIWVRDGSVPEPVQAKILSNSSQHYKN